MSWQSSGSQWRQQGYGSSRWEAGRRYSEYDAGGDQRYEYKAGASGGSWKGGQEYWDGSGSSGGQFWKGASGSYQNDSVDWIDPGRRWTGEQRSVDEEGGEKPSGLPRARSRSRSRSSPRYIRQRSRSPDYSNDNQQDTTRSSEESDSSERGESESVSPEGLVVRREAGGLLEFDAPCTVRGVESFSEEEKKKLARFATWEEAVERGILLQNVVDALETSGAARPTPIQQHAIPVIAAGVDVVASAQTGTGKSLAFIAPIVSKIGKLSSTVPRPFFPGRMAQASPLCMVLAPTRELAMQLVKDFESCSVSLAQGEMCRTMAAYGGETASRQADRICAEQLDVLVATPGRLLEFNETGRVSLGYVKFLVLDEADQMLSMGLEAYVNNILMDTDLTEPSGRQTLLFSATIDNPNLKPWLEGEVGCTGNRVGTEVHSREVLRLIDRCALVDFALVNSVCDMLISQAIVFVASRDRGKDLHKRICGSGSLCCGLLQGKQLQAVREEVVRRFRTNEDQVLVSTSVAARGLDFPNVTLVINYDMPESIETYTHRIGRTGRIGHEGRAIAYYNPASKDRRIGDALIAFLRKYNQPVSEELKNAGIRHRAIVGVTAARVAVKVVPRIVATIIITALGGIGPLDTARGDQ
ncbi:ATP-dependent RNA helicase DDX3Y, putative [Perkinsus marinus ATCC 50983]|uniref:RNA helicase n=1 Tax=Perkinsus marinus (strain ATCC 50983 / TXsc) TaxID=423536 RepID=C5KUR6_PERM5|nr:ATP-dependent RNA helicase DDX3Y, putative [Perkinsus marinus ATCC 50983]EER11787.1 ATP-dependent RNA helicase DDX3Y, putative [Perkinsus marinus ATCC 50983]|eukprot:XP_002779992.1 ATP-dependent RNA helicase DDX3Y, putative [Perkinsus marinus ATCC 50983]